jgi:hypothetical protein
MILNTRRCASILSTLARGPVVRGPLGGVAAAENIDSDRLCDRERAGCEEHVRGCEHQATPHAGVAGHHRPIGAPISGVIERFSACAARADTCCVRPVVPLDGEDARATMMQAAPSDEMRVVFANVICAALPSNWCTGPPESPGHAGSGEFAPICGRSSLSCDETARAPHEIVGIPLTASARASWSAVAYVVG